MQTIHVLLDTIDKVKNFVTIASRYPYDVDLCSGRYVVDGKSIMGIFSVNLKKAVEVRIMSDDCAPLLRDLAHLRIPDKA